MELLRWLPDLQSGYRWVGFPYGPQGEVKTRVTSDKVQLIIVQVAFESHKRTSNRVRKTLVDFPRPYMRV